MHKIRQRLLKKQEEFMHLKTDQELANMGDDDLLTILRASDYPVRERGGDLSHNEMLTIIANQQRQRSLVVWHDHATILNNGLIMITVHVVYDKAMFLTNEEYYNRTGKIANVYTVSSGTARNIHVSSRKFTKLLFYQTVWNAFLAWQIQSQQQMVSTSACTLNGET